MSTSNPAADTRPAPQLLALQGPVNRVVRGVLRIPLLGRAAGKRLITVYVVGRKSGRRYAIPVAYARHGEAVLVASPFAWIRNLRTGEPVDIRFEGKRRPADVEVVTDEAGVVEILGILARDNRQFAKFNNITLDDAGEPSAADMRQIWSVGVRGVRLTPR